MPLALRSSTDPSKSTMGYFCFGSNYPPTIGDIRRKAGAKPDTAAGQLQLFEIETNQLPGNAENQNQNEETEGEQELHRGLKSRHITMIGENSTISTLPNGHINSTNSTRRRHRDWLAHRQRRRPRSRWPSLPPTRLYHHRLCLQHSHDFSRRNVHLATTWERISRLCNSLCGSRSWICVGLDVNTHTLFLLRRQS